MSKQQPNRTTSKPASKPAGKSSRQPIDPLLLQRLEDLGQRRPAGAPLPPPSPTSATRTAAAKASGARPAPGSQEAKLAAAAERSAAARAAKQGGPAVKTATKPGRKAKPARASKVASVAVSAATTLALAGLFARQDTGTTDSVVLTAGTDPGAATASTTATTAPPTTVAAAPGATAAPTTVATTPAAAPNTIADGTYSGQGSRNRFGTVQVQAVYSGGTLTDVQILSYPDGDRRSLRISQIAIPMLVNQSVQAGGASISGVSGATYTSRSYVASLQSAIDAAKQASGVTG